MGQKAGPVVRLKARPSAGIIEASLWGEVPSETTPPVIPSRPRSGVEAPSSLAQQRLWRLSRVEPRTPIKNFCKGMRLTGRLDVRALEAGLGRIVERHESLRTTFEDRNGQPVQVIRSETGPSLVVMDLAQLAERERWSEVRRVAAREAQEAFDLTRGPLLRVTLIRLAEDEHALILSAHPIVFDRGSFAVFSSELGTWYEAFCSGGTPQPLPSPPIQYSDVAASEAGTLVSEVLGAEVEFWKRQLAGSLPSLQLPVDRSRPAVSTLRGAEQRFEWGASLTEGLEELSRQEGVTLLVTLLSAFNALLCRYTGQDEIVVGAPISGRDAPGSE